MTSKGIELAMSKEVDHEHVVEVELLKLLPKV